MGLVLAWSHLDPLVLPFLIALTVAAILAIPLRSAAERGGFPRVRERCVGCRAEGELLRVGQCPERCVVNGPGPVALSTFVATACLAIWVVLDPVDVARYVLPFGESYGPAASALEALIVATCLGASVLVASFIAQGREVYREGMIRGAAISALAVLALGENTPGMLARWTSILLPVALLALVLGVATQWRARHDRPTFGLRSLGVATFPLFLVAFLAILRMGQFLSAAYG